MCKCDNTKNCNQGPSKGIPLWAEVQEKANWQSYPDRKISTMTGFIQPLNHCGTILDLNFSSIIYKETPRIEGYLFREVIAFVRKDFQHRKFYETWTEALHVTNRYKGEEYNRWEVLERPAKHRK